MENILKSTTINKLIRFSLLTLIVCLIFVVSKYIGLNYFFVKIVKSLVPVFIAVFVSFILEPVIGLFFEKGIKRKYSVWIVYGLLITVAAFVLYFTIPQIVDQIKIFIDNIPGLIDTFSFFMKKIGISMEQEKNNEIFNNIVLFFSENIMKYVGMSLSFVFDLLLGISGAVFLSLDFPKFREGVKKRIPDRLKKPVVFLGPRQITACF